MDSLLLNFTVKKNSLNIYLVKFSKTKTAGKRDKDPDGSKDLVIDNPFFLREVMSHKFNLNTAICCRSWSNSHAGTAPSESHKMSVSLYVPNGSL
jgi:hypothetical protein